MSTNDTDDTLADQTSQPLVRGATVGSYQVGAVLGQGGMGEVVLARDSRLDRDVAIKRMRTRSPGAEALARFEREARIQARLDHPAIVPVYEIGRDERDEPYFTMKRLVGTTLADLLAARTASPQKLLRALVDVCLAVALAHRRKIVHRDLKPSNIMLGEYGEVYVLDWGVARVLDGHGQLDTDPVRPVERDDDATKTGSLLGTPGYMAPEQIRSSDVGPPADVYALGVILFEVLTGERLHPAGVAALSSTLELEDPSPARRAADRVVPPELDRLCVAALDRDPEARPTARELADALQRYLDGDRDVEARRALAASELATARRALDAGRRADAVHHAGHAVALDPRSEDAVSLLTSLIVEPPRELPREVALAIDTEEDLQRRQRSGRAVWTLAAFLVVAVLSLLLPIQSLAAVAIEAAIVGVMTLIAYVNWRVRSVPTWLFLLLQLGLVLAFSRFVGPFVLTPALICGLLVGLCMQPWANDRPWVLFAWGIAAILGPIALEAAGVLAATWERTPEGILSYSAVRTSNLRVGELATVSSHVVAIVVFTGYALAITRDHRRAQRGLFVQAWHLRQLLPRAR